MEISGHSLLVLALIALHSIVYFGWLRRFKVALLPFHFFWARTRNGLQVAAGPANSHHLAHARFDAFLLRVAAAFVTFPAPSSGSLREISQRDFAVRAHIMVSGMAEMDFESWTGPFFLLHKVPVIASVWLQFVPRSSVPIPFDSRVADTLW